MELGKAAQARRYYHHVLHGGTLKPEDVSRMVQTIEELEAQIAALTPPPDAELDAMVIWKLANMRDADDPEYVAAITALRAQPDWKAMAERLGEALRECSDDLEAYTRVEYDWPNVHPAMETKFQNDLSEVHAARAALSDLAKMKGE